MGEGVGPTGFERLHKIVEAPSGKWGGSLKSERFLGPDGREWARWIVPDITEYNSIPKTKKYRELRELIAKVAGYRDSVADEKFLHESFAKIEELFFDGKISAAEEALWGERINSRDEYVREVVSHLKAADLAEAQGIVGPQWALEEFRDGEEYLRPNSVISPGNEPRYWVLYKDDEGRKKQFYVRSTLAIIGYKKGLAPGTKELYMDELRELPVDLDKEAMKVMFKMEGALAATGIYSTIIGDPKFLAHESKYDTSLKTVFCSVITKDPNVDKYKKEIVEIKPDDEKEVIEYKNKLEKKREKLEQFYSADHRKKTIAGLKKDYGDDILTRGIEITSENKVFDVKTYEGLEGLEKELREGTPDSMYKHKKGYGTIIDRASFKVLKKAVRYWLITEGRDLLLTDEEKKVRRDKDGKVVWGGREEFFGNLEDKFSTKEERARYKARRLKELMARARDAEQVSWNFANDTNMLETFDSRAFRPPGTQRHSPSFFWNLHVWVPFHLQERMEQKIHRKIYPEIKIKEIKNKAGKAIDVPVMDDSLGGKPIGKVEALSEFEILDAKFANGKEWVKIQYDDVSKKEGWIEEKNSKPTEIPELEAKEEWSVAGPVLIYILSHGGLRDEKGRLKIPDDFKILPDSLIRGPLFDSVFQGGRRAGLTTSPEVPVSRKESASFFAMLNDIGNDVLYKTDDAAKTDLFNRINWKEISDNAFVPFNFDEMRWADVIANVLKKGNFQASKIDGQDFSEAVRNLRLSQQQRDKLLLCYYGLNPRASTLAPAVGWMRFNDFKREFVKVWPNYYLPK